MITRRFRLLALACAASLLSLSPASAQEKVLRIAMTASDIPTTTGMPNNGFEGMRFLGFPIFEGMILFDLTKTDQLATLRRAWPRPGNSRPMTRRSGSSISGRALSSMTARTSTPMR